MSAKRMQRDATPILPRPYFSHDFRYLHGPKSDHPPSTSFMEVVTLCACKSMESDNSGRGKEYSMMNFNIETNSYVLTDRQNIPRGGILPPLENPPV